MADSSCSIYTERHFQHSTIWTVTGVTLPSLCIACAIEILEDKQHQLSVRICAILNEFSQSIKKQSTPLVKMITSDWKITEHICSVLIGKRS